MTNVHSYSSSQESELFDDAAMQHIQQEIGPMDSLPILEGDILDVDNKDNIMYVAHQQHTNIPVLDEFAGHFNFKLVHSSQGAGKYCVYSVPLQKIFIDMEQTLPLRFEWDPTVPGLFLRTKMVFSYDQCRNDPVVRCHNHMAPSNAGNNMIRPDILKHVVRCLDPESIYEELAGGHLSVTVPLGLPQAGANYVQMNYQFFCKNSCTSGMNRRPTELVFTLEDEHGEVLGRRRLCVRVCSCPKRDKEKEEGERQTGKARSGGSTKKRKLSAPPGKKLVAQGLQDTREYTVQFKVPGRENYQAILKQAFDLLAGQATRTGQHEFLRPYMDDLLHKMQ